MRIRLPHFALLPVLLLPALAAPALAQAPQPREPTAEELRQAQQRGEAWQAYATRVARALGRSDGSRDLALAALLEATGRPGGGDVAAPATPDAARWRADAAARGAGDTITQQLLLAAGLASGDEAAALAAARRWESLEQGNLAPLLLQGLSPEATLAAAARSGRNAPDPYPLQRWIATTLRRHPPTAADWAAFGEGARPSAEAHAAAWASALQASLAPDYQGVLGACTGRALRLAGRAEACRHLSTLLLSRPQTVLDERIGLSLARALTRGAAERAPLDARRRGVDWRQEQMAALARREADASGDAAAGADAFAKALADPTVDTEDAMVRRILSAAGMATEPPAGWLAPWQRTRR